MNLALIPVYGGLGAAMATVVTYAFAAFAAGIAMPSMRKTAISMARALNPFAAARRLILVYRGD